MKKYICVANLVLEYRLFVWGCKLAVLFVLPVKHVKLAEKKKEKRRTGLIISSATMNGFTNAKPNK